MVNLVLTGKNKVYIFAAGFLVLIISALSAWRLSVILAAHLDLWSAYPLLLVLGLGFVLFLLVVWYALCAILVRFFRRQEGAGAYQRLLAAIVGATILSLVGLLLATPTGLAHVVLELEADNVWSPTLFSMTWLYEGVGETSFNLPHQESIPATLEISADSGEIWLVKATWPNGLDLPPADFSVTGNWQQHQINWEDYQNQPVWIGSGGTSAVLRWQGVASGPLTLVFARHSRAGQVTVRWNDQPYTLNLLDNAATEFTSLTLPAQAPAVWRAELPLSALLAEEMNIGLTPDPGGQYSMVIRQLKISGVPGQTIELRGPTLQAALKVKGGQTTLDSSGGVHFKADDPDKPMQLFLVQPLVLLPDWVWFIPWLENGLLMVYLAVIGLVGAGSVALYLPLPVVTNANRLAISLMMVLLIGELGPRLYFPPAGQYYAWTPNLHQVFRPDPEALPGITGESNFITNSQGIRGDEFSPGDDYRILTIGASTTECLYLDQTETWPYLVQTGLNQRQGLQVWVGNIGKSARKTHDHILQLKYLLPQYPKLDAVFLLLGASDLFLTLRYADSPNNPYHLTGPGAQRAALERAFDVVAEQKLDAPFYQQTATWRIINRVHESQARVDTSEEIEVEDETGHVYIERRLKRKNAQIVEELPDYLAKGLAEYTQNVHQIIDLAQARGVRVILATQPMLWRVDLTQGEKDLLWLGQGPGREYFYSPAALDRAISMYNQQLLDICAQRQVECLDLAPTIPKTAEYFYDDAHYTEAGARRVADVVQNYLLSQPPFNVKNK